MKILQLIDTLHAGGAEQMAVNYANSIVKYNGESHICITRETGILMPKLNQEVKLHFLNKKNVFDLSALFRLSGIIKKNNIDIVQAHGSSWFFAVLSKIAGSKFKLIWHDHYGNSEFLRDRSIYPLKLFSKLFDGIISVNKKLQIWASENLKCENIIFLSNFVEDNLAGDLPKFNLRGESKYNIICVANLRPQKDHNSLIKAFNMVRKNYDVSLHLVGKDFNDDYSQKMKSLFSATESLFYYGEQQNVHSFLIQSDIAVLCSLSEGLPLVLLEYANAELPVICTKVGECSEVIGENGKLINPNSPEEIAFAITSYLNDKDLRIIDSAKLKKSVKKLYSEGIIIQKYLEFCNKLC